jgi:hypothetical protein
MVLFSEYKKKRDADKKKANFKTFGNNRATSDNRDGQTACLTADNLGVKVTVLADCYALLRIRPLSISCAECSVVISCGKVDYDKSG